MGFYMSTFGDAFPEQMMYKVYHLPPQALALPIQ